MNIIEPIQLFLAASLSIRRAQAAYVTEHSSVGRSVCLSVRKVYCGKAVELIRMPFGIMSGVGREMGVIDGGHDCRREGAVFLVGGLIGSVPL